MSTQLRSSAPRAPIYGSTQRRNVPLRQRWTRPMRGSTMLARLDQLVRASFSRRGASADSTLSEAGAQACLRASPPASPQALVGLDARLHAGWRCPLRAAQRRLPDGDFTEGDARCVSGGRCDNYLNVPRKGRCTPRGAPSTHFCVQVDAWHTKTPCTSLASDHLKRWLLSSITTAPNGSSLLTYGWRAD